MRVRVWRRKDAEMTERERHRDETGTGNWEWERKVQLQVLAENNMYVRILASVLQRERSGSLPAPLT